VAPDQEKNMATAEVVIMPNSMPNTANLAPPESCMIAAEDLWKTYDMGSEQQVHALRGVNLGFGQVDIDESDWLPGYPVAGKVLAE
jgi:hypothetical protein